MNEQRNSFAKYMAGKTAMEDTYTNLVAMIISLEARAANCGSGALMNAVHKLKRAAVRNGATKKGLRTLRAQYDKLSQDITTAEAERNRQLTK